MAIIAGERVGSRGVRAPMLPTPTIPSFRGAACTAPGAARDWQTAAIDAPGHQRFLAANYCEHCPIVAKCLTEALARGEVNGVWGGLTEAELRRARDLAKGRIPKTPADAPAPAAADESVSEPVALGVAA